MCSSKLLDTISCFLSTSKDSGTLLTGDSFGALSTGKGTGAVISTVTGGCGKTTGSDIGAGGEGDVAWGGGGGGGGDEGGESILDSAMTAGNCVGGGGGDATAVVVAGCGLDVT